MKDIITDRSAAIIHFRSMTKKSILFMIDLLDAMIEEKETVMAYGSSGIDLIQKKEGGILVWRK